MPTDIQWTDEVWNCLRGCSRVSAGCGDATGGGCYAERQAYRFAGEGMPYEGIVRMTPKGPRWTGKVVLVEEKLQEPLRWKKPRRVFVNSMSDLFHESIPDEWIDKMFAVMALVPKHTFQCLTKRPKEMLAHMQRLSRNIEPLEKAARGMGYTFNYNGLSLLEWPIRNVLLGVSIEDQKTADERIPLLLETPAAVRWISAEPLLGSVDLDNYLYTRFQMGGARHMYNHLSWCVVGGESGPGSRPFDIAWARSIIRQCKAAGVPVFMKQLGAFPTAMTRHDSLDSHWAIQPSGQLRMILKNKKGGEISEWPEDLKVREFPEANGAILL